jgi:hypothetical protein
MTKSIRLALLACAGFLGLAFAAPALAAYKPSLTIEQTSYKLGAPVTVDNFVVSPANHDATAKITIYGPAGYSANITQAPGTKIGTVAAVVKANALAGILLPLAGDVVVANGADPNIVTASQQCTNRPTNQATWLLKTTLQSQQINIPIFVNKPATGPSLTEEVCFASPYVPQTAGGAVLGAQLVSADFTVKNVFTNASVRSSASRSYEWSGVFTPFVVGTATANLAGTNEWRTYVGLPQSLTFKRVASKTGISLAGILKIPGVNLTTIRLRLYAGKKAQPAPNATSGGTGKAVARSRAPKSNGKYTLLRPPVQARTFFQMRFENYITKCNPPSPTGLPVPCNGEDLAAMTSNQVRALPPPKKK